MASVPVSVYLAGATAAERLGGRLMPTTPPSPMENVVASVPPGTTGTIRIADTLPLDGAIITGIERTRDDPSGTLGGPFTVIDPPGSRFRDFTYLAPSTTPYTLTERSASGSAPDWVFGPPVSVQATLTPPPVGGGGGTPAPVDGRTTSANAVRRAQDVADIYGVAGHLVYPAYQNYAQVTAAMDYLGCKNFRDGWGTGRQAVADYVINSFRPRGIKLCLVHDARDWPGGFTAAQMVAQHKAYGYLPDMRFAEGSNELDLSGNLPSARAQALAHTAAFKADPAAAHVIRCGPSLADTNTAGKYQAVGVLPDAQACTFHDYPGGDRMMSGPRGAITPDGSDGGYAITNTMGRNARYVVPTPSGTPVDVISTECGFSTGTTGDAGKNMPDTARSAQELRIWLEHARGIGSGDRAVNVLLSCNYELVDQGTGTDTEVRYGLFTNTWQPKPPATAIRNQMQLLVDPASNASTFTPVPLAYGLGGSDDDTRSLLMQKADGSWWLAIWQEWVTWNGSTILNPAPKTLTLTLPSPRTVNTYQPTSGTTSTARGRNSSFSVSCGASPLIIEVI